MDNEVEKKSKTKNAKTIQISTATTGSGLITVFALRDDGSIWHKFMTVGEDWKKLKDIE